MLANIVLVPKFAGAGNMEIIYETTVITLCCPYKI